MKRRRVLTIKPSGRKMNDSSKKQILPASSQRRQTLIQAFFRGPAKTIPPEIKKSSVLMTPPTPVSPQTPDTPPTEQSQTPSGTPPTASVKESSVQQIVARVSIENRVQSTDRKVLQQMYLDLGQGDFAKRTVCNTCGMLYVHGVSEDTKDHSRVCEDYRKGVPFNMKSARIISKYAGGSVVEVRPSDSSALQTKLKRVKHIVDLDLGFSPSSGSQTERTAYLFIASNRVVGMATAEIIQSAHVLQNSFDRSATSQKALVGIHQLWVHASSRKQNIATHLVDTARSKLVFGLTVSPELVAFSSPTEAGAAFARKYTRAKSGDDKVDVLVYDCY